MANNSIKKIFVTKLSDTATTDLEGIGVIRIEGDKIYKWVTYNTGTGAVAAVAGNMTVYHGDNGRGTVAAPVADVTSDYTDGLIGAGTLVGAPGNGEYGWIQIAGLAVVTPALTGGADGDAVTTVGAADGTFDTRDTAADEFSPAVAIDVSAKLVLLRCPW
jgi:hypothetical protein